MILARVTSNPCAAANNRAPGALMERPSVKEEITSVVNLNVCVQPRRDPLEAVAPQTIPSVMPMAMPMVILPAIVPKIIPTPAPIAIPTPVQSSCAPPRVPVVISPTRQTRLVCIANPSGHMCIMANSDLWSPECLTS